MESVLISINQNVPTTLDIKVFFYCKTEYIQKKNKQGFNLVEKSYMRKRQAGYTLIELIVTLVILGILAVMTFPKFVDITTEARMAVLEDIQGVFQSTSSLYGGYAEVKGYTTGYYTINGQSVWFHSGYPKGHWNNCWRYILSIGTAPQYTPASNKCVDYALCGVGHQSTIPDVPAATGGYGIIVWPQGYYISDKCFTYYYNPETGDVPFTGIIDSGC